jgi:hypothetical protein
MEALHKERHSNTIVRRRAANDGQVGSWPRVCLLPTPSERAREAGILCQTEVAARLDEPQPWVSQVETGETRMHVIELRAYCLAIGLEPWEFVAALEAALSNQE